MSARCLYPLRSGRDDWSVCGELATDEYEYGVPGPRHYRCDAHRARTSFFPVERPLPQLTLPVSRRPERT